MNTKNRIGRRDFLKYSGLGLGLAVSSLASTKVYDVFGQAGDSKTINIGVIGTGARGRSLMEVLLLIPGVKVPALCDINQANLDKGAMIVKGYAGNTPEGYSKGPYDYRRMLERDDLDGVMIATSVKWHVPMSVDAMKAGKNVGCEVPVGYTLEELWELVKTKEKTGRHYILLENYNYTRDRMMICNMARQNIFGEPYYAECGYIHDCKNLCFNPDGSLTWRGERAVDNYEHPYATHSLGPVSKWFGINEGDRMEYLTTMMSPPKSLHLYAVEKFGPDSPAAKINFKRGDFYTTTIHTSQGKVIRLDFDYMSNRPAEMYYLMQGTKGTYNSRAGIYLKGGKEQYESTTNYQDKYDSPCWKESTSAAGKAGHGGGDYFVIRDFVEMVRQNKEPWIDVYDAAAWSSIGHCSKLSLDGQSKPVEMPDFTKGKWKDTNWRKTI
ncbi:MAG: hypothetical protein A2Y13_09285 [Planctomycetes bacterium GWC2_45_44]|nr:MAG: hypothetical protein A2Y13_09285 [Planctomycetes bacterium GWC2_45_44]HBR20151.1 glycosyl hydrolase [Phycisphaerales bacterium]